MWLETNTANVQDNDEGATLRHSVSFSRLSRNGSTTNRFGPGSTSTCTSQYRFRASTTRGQDEDYGFVSKSSGNRCRDHEYRRHALLEEGDEKLQIPRKIFNRKVKKSPLSPTVWLSLRFFPRVKSTSKMNAQSDLNDCKPWRSMGTLQKSSTTSIAPTAVSRTIYRSIPSSSRAESFYLLDDFLKPTDSEQISRCILYQRRSKVTPVNTRHSLQAPSPTIPPIPPPPPPLRYLTYRKPLHCECLCCDKHNRHNPALAIKSGRKDHTDDTGSNEGHKNGSGSSKITSTNVSKSANRSNNGYMALETSGQDQDTRTDADNSKDVKAMDKLYTNFSISKMMGVSQRRYDPYGRPLPMTPIDAINYYGTHLTKYEMREIMKYKEIWYLGVNAIKIEGTDNDYMNHGYDDENGIYKKVLHDHIAYRYEVLQVVGKGSFGQVIKAKDHKTGSDVAIKIIRFISNSYKNKKRIQNQGTAEVSILERIRRKDADNSHNVIHMKDNFYFRNHLCIIFDLMRMNLYELIKKNSYRGFGLDTIRTIAVSLLRCLKLLYRESIIHCDLKPENIMLTDRGLNYLKVTDFGSSCFSSSKIYSYIQSRFYRSPEIILGIKYNAAIDMWSFGCIMAELYTGYPLFPGENEPEQLGFIMEILGHPPYELVLSAASDKANLLTSEVALKRIPGAKTLADALNYPDTSFVDFVSKCLEWNPVKRLTAEQALKHEWIKGYGWAGLGTLTGATAGTIQANNSLSNNYRFIRRGRWSNRSAADLDDSRHYLN